MALGLFGVQVPHRECTLRHSTPAISRPAARRPDHAATRALHSESGRRDEPATDQCPLSQPSCGSRRALFTAATAVLAGLQAGCYAPAAKALDTSVGEDTQLWPLTWLLSLAAAAAAHSPDRAQAVAGQDRRLHVHLPRELVSCFGESCSMWHAATRVAWVAESLVAAVFRQRCVFPKPYRRGGEPLCEPVISIYVKAARRCRSG